MLDWEDLKAEVAKCLPLTDPVRLFIHSLVVVSYGDSVP